MKTATVKELKQELSNYGAPELMAICLRLSKFKKENKELLTYLLYESHNEDYYIENVKSEIDNQFELINATSYYFIKKNVRKILSSVKKYIRYSGQKETEIALLLYFLYKLKAFNPSYKNNVVLTNMFNSQINIIHKKLVLLDEDLQFDYGLELKTLR